MADKRRLSKPSSGPGLVGSWILPRGMVCPRSPRYVAESPLARRSLAAGIAAVPLGFSGVRASIEVLANVLYRHSLIVTSRLFIL